MTSNADLDLGPRQHRLPWKPQTSSLLVYGLVTFSVTLAATDSQTPGQLLLVLLGNALAIWVAHAFADTTAHDSSALKGLLHAAPMLGVAAPAGAVLFLGWVWGWTGEHAVIVAEVVNLVALIGLQLLNARRKRFRLGQFAVTVLLDALAAAVVVALIAFLK